MGITKEGSSYPLVGETSESKKLTKNKGKGKLLGGRPGPDSCCLKGEPSLSITPLTDCQILRGGKKNQKTVPSMNPSS